MGAKEALARQVVGIDQAIAQEPAQRRIGLARHVAQPPGHVARQAGEQATQLIQFRRRQRPHATLLSIQLNTFSRRRVNRS